MILERIWCSISHSQDDKDLVTNQDADLNWSFRGATTDRDMNSSSRGGNQCKFSVRIDFTKVSVATSGSNGYITSDDASLARGRRSCGLTCLKTRA